MVAPRGTPKKTPEKKPVSVQKTQGRSKKPWGIIFWAAFFVVVFCLFVINIGRIQKTLEDTGVFERLMNRQVSGTPTSSPLPFLHDDSSPAAGPDGAESTGTKPSSPEGAPKAAAEKPKAPVESKPQAEIKPAPVAERPAENPEQKSGGRESPPAVSTPQTEPGRNPGTSKPGTAVTTNPPPRETQTKEPPPVSPPADSVRPSGSVQNQGSSNLRERGLYFIQIDSSGAILRNKVTRQLPVSDSPMLDALNSLLSGPNREEQNRGLISLIPRNVKILNATVRGNTAYISFSEEFQYNTYGVEGYAGALRQIIWTVTEFSNVRDVQILIEGRRIDYLGEGIWIGSPIGRDL